MFWWIRLSIILVASTFPQSSLGRNHFYIVFDSCDVLETWESCKMNCSLSKNNKLTSYLNILENASRLAFSIQLLGKSPIMKEYVKIFDRSLGDICPLLSTPSSGNFLLLVLNEIQSYGRIPHCPTEKGIYYMKDYHFSPERLPPYVPEGQFVMILGLSGYRMNGTHANCANLSLKGSVRSKLNPFRGRAKN